MSQEFFLDHCTWRPGIKIHWGKSYFIITSSMKFHDVNRKLTWQEEEIFIRIIAPTI